MNNPDLEKLFAVWSPEHKLQLKEKLANGELPKAMNKVFLPNSLHPDVIRTDTVLAPYLGGLANQFASM